MPVRAALKKLVLYTSIFLLLGLIALEIILRLIGAFYLLPGVDSFLNKKTSIVVLGDSTSGKSLFKEIRSWPDILQENINKNLWPVSIINEARPGATSTSVLMLLESVVYRHEPQILITMVGINDSSHFLPNRPDDDFLFLYKSKVYRLIKTVLLNPDTKVKLTSTDFKNPSTPQWLRTLSEHSAQDEPFKQTLIEIETFLENKTPTEKSRFYTHLADKLQPVWNQKVDLQQLSKSLDFRRKAIQYDAVLESNIDSAMVAARVLKKNEICKEIVENAFSQKLLLSDSVLNQLTLCLVHDEIYVKDVLTRNNSRFEFKKSDTPPTEENFKKIHKILSHQKICWIILNYPTLQTPESISNLKSTSQLEVFIVENKENFDKALKAKAYDDLFYDRFGKSFGHTTTEGSTLIADQVMKTLYKLKDEGRCGL